MRDDGQEPPNHEDDVHVWEVARLVELGYRVADAEELADRGADWHRIRDLLAMGCSRADARRIIL